MSSTPLSVRAFFARLKWLDGQPLLSVIEPYRLDLFERFFSRDEHGRLRYNLGLFGRGKKNWKTADLILQGLYCLVSEPAPGYDADCSLLANDKEQSGEDLGLAKKLVTVNPVLDEWLKLKRDVIERRDGRGFLESLAAGDVVGTHGKSRRWVGYDEIHGYRTWDILEAMQPDPHRLDAQQAITSYASLFHRPGVPLFDLKATGKAGRDPRMLFSWYAGDHCTDPTFADGTPEERANPSMASWADSEYLEQQRRRLPAHKYRRLHLNLPGVPEGSAYQPEPVMDAIDRGVLVRPPMRATTYRAFVDMSGGSLDDAVLGIGHVDADGRGVLDCLVDQGQRAPFDPNAAVDRFVRTVKSYGLHRVQGDKYAGLTFQHQFEAQGIRYEPADRSKSDLYEAFEPLLNAHRVVLLDVPLLEQQLLGLVWRGGRIDHPTGEHDDYANAAVGVMTGLLAAEGRCPHCDDPDCDGLPPLALMDSPEARAWFARHPDPDAPLSAELPHDAPDAETTFGELLEQWIALTEAGKQDAAQQLEDQIRAHVAETEATDPVVGARLRGLLDSMEEEADARA